MTPWKVFLYLSIVLLSLGVLILVFPQQGFDLFGVKIKMPTFEEIFLNKKPQYANIDKIVSEEKVEPADAQKQTAKKDNIVSFQSSAETKQRLEKFFLEFEQAKQRNGSIRIVHYGDSQIEGDRVSGKIRSELRKELGGYGQGMIPIYTQSVPNGVSYTYSSNWEFYSVLKPIKGFNRYGLPLSAIKAIEDSSSAKASLSIHFHRLPQCDLKIYYSSPDRENRIIISNDQTQISDVAVAAGANLKHIVIPKEQITNNLKLECDAGLELYGLDISADVGVYVDNIPLRGSSGWGIRGSNPYLLGAFFRESDVDMIIMQFGVNAIPQAEDEVVEDYGFYKNEFAKQLKYLSSVAPDAVIVVIGVSDRSIRSGSNYITNPNIFKLREAQREAALENGCVFWDLFMAMGGENSMPSWVLRETPLANKDFIHFNNKGAELVATMFLKALSKEAESYKATNNTIKKHSN